MNTGQWTAPATNRMMGRFAQLYGEAGVRCFDRMRMMIGRYGLGTNVRSLSSQWSEKDCVLITYADMVRQADERPLATLRRFLSERLAGAVNIVHILPFFPSSSDDGFSVSDYRAVDPGLGTWEDVRALGRDFRLMFDLVLNHCSRRSSWFKDYISEIAPGRDFFIEVDPKIDLSSVVRPRNRPLLTKVQVKGKTRHVWTTFSEDQIDLNFANPDVLFDFFDILLFYLAQGVRIIRLDAIAYLWKKIGTSCIHLPETHAVVKLFRDLLEIVAPETILLTETNVPHAENVSYFGNGDEANMVYQFSLPPLLLHALRTGCARTLTEWAVKLPEPPPGCTFFNFTASHDGIGVRPLEGLVSEQEFAGLVEGTLPRGGQVSRRRNADGTESPYELNVTYFDAVSEPEQGNVDMDIARFMCSQTIPLVLKGIPAVYFNSVVGGRNDTDGVKRTGHARSVNRQKWDLHTLEGLLDEEKSVPSRVYGEYVALLRLRARHPAFHPDGAQRVLDLGDAVFAIERTARRGAETVTSISNFTSGPVKIPLDGRIPALAGARRFVDLIRKRTYRASTRTLRLGPYETCWLA